MIHMKATVTTVAGNIVVEPYGGHENDGRDVTFSDPSGEPVAQVRADKFVSVVIERVVE